MFRQTRDGRYYDRNLWGDYEVTPDPRPFGIVKLTLSVIVGAALCLTIILAPAGIKLLQWAGKRSSDYELWRDLNG